ncbi:MAG: hypothetical protein AB1374_13020 [Bacillota bacterium]
MQGINTSYAYYFNKKYRRTGHLFQDRFRSEVIENDAYLLAAVRYVHNNPVKAKVVTEPSAYRWSSYNLYLDKDNSGQRIETKMILEMFSKNRDKAIELFTGHTNEGNEDVFMAVFPARLPRLPARLGRGYCWRCFGLIY